MSNDLKTLPQDPTSPEGWQEAVDLAHAYRAIDSARIYGLIEGGPVVDVERCNELLERGELLGYTPNDSAIETVVRHLLVGEEP